VSSSYQTKDGRPVRLRKPPANDVWLAVVLTFMTAFWGDLWAHGSNAPRYLLSIITSIAITMPLALRRVNPFLTWALTMTAAAVQMIFLPLPTWSWVAVCVVTYVVARQLPLRTSVALVTVTGVGALLAPLRWSMVDPNFSWRDDFLTVTLPLVLLCGTWIFLPFLMGRRDQEAAQAERERTENVRQRYEAQLAQREEATQASEARIRNEIARELHDVVAHSLSVMIVQAEGGKALARKDPQKAVDVLDTISETGRSALSQMRRIVGVLRGGPEETAVYHPSPDLSDLPNLVTSAGQNVTFETVGEPREVSETVGLTVYRIIQEALTNVLKHAGGQAHAHVRVTYLPDELLVEIQDDGGAPGAALPAEVEGPGYGVKGMRERVGAMGGTIRIGANAQGWLVSAAIPT